MWALYCYLFYWKEECFLNNFGAEQKYFSSTFIQNSNQSTTCTLINLLSWITVKRVYMAYPGQRFFSNFLTKPGFHMVNINRYIFGHELGPAVCYHEFNAFEELNK